jgi:hypothetical protein
VKKPDLVVLVAIWEFFTAFAAFVGLGFIILLAFQPRTFWFGQNVDFEVSGPLIYFALVVGGFVLLFYLIAALAAGLGVLSGREYGRVLSLAHGGIGLLFFPVGTVIGVLEIVYLTRADVREYFK